jgi:hypothetical protein
VTIGLILLVASLNSNFMDTTKIVIDGEEKIKDIPNINLCMTGWFLVAFSLLHFYPMTIVNWIKNKLQTRELSRNTEHFV